MLQEAKNYHIIVEPKLHVITDKLSEILIFFIVLFSPWAFGTTEAWSIWTMNITAYSLGILFIIKQLTRQITNYKPSSKLLKIKANSKYYKLRLLQKICTIMLTCSIIILLAYILISAINARATYNHELKEYIYFEGINLNLPHSYDAKSTWLIFWQYLGFACLFFSTRDWLETSKNNKNENLICPRLKKLLYLIFINGGALALVSILQRIYFQDNDGRLLFLVEPVINKTNISQFGPFAYRGNAATYFNLIWPIGLGLFLQQTKRSLEINAHKIGKNPEIILVPLIIISASCPVISSARAGAFILFIIILISAFSIILSKIKSKTLRISALFTLITAILLAYTIGWEKLEPRLLEIFSDDMSKRKQIYSATFEMIDNYGKYGSGPGSFETVIQFELGNILFIWQSWVHNDYLEFYLTFGLIGSLIIMSIIAFLIVLSFISLYCSNLNILINLILISIIGLLINAFIDFPLQTHSILILLSILAAFLSYNKFNYR